MNDVTTINRNNGIDDVASAKNTIEAIDDSNSKTTPMNQESIPINNTMVMNVLIEK